MSEQTMKQALKAYEDSAKELCAATERDFPVGTRVRVTLGKSVITGEIEMVNAYWWSDPGEVRMRNEATGIQRRFNAASSDIEKLEATNDPPK